MRVSDFCCFCLCSFEWVFCFLFCWFLGVSVLKKKEQCWCPRNPLSSHGLGHSLADNKSEISW